MVVRCSARETRVSQWKLVIPIYATINKGLCRLRLFVSRIYALEKKYIYIETMIFYIWPTDAINGIGMDDSVRRNNSTGKKNEESSITYRTIIILTTLIPIFLVASLQTFRICPLPDSLAFPYLPMYLCCFSLIQCIYLFVFVMNRATYWCERMGGHEGVDY